MDHIPPKSLFPRPLPNDLITVPACAKCNGEASKDDEYFRLALQVREGIAEHPDVMKSRPTLIRSLEKPEAKGMRNSFLGSVVLAERITPGGIFVGNVLALKTRMDRVDGVVARIVRGLFFRHRGIIVPRGYSVVAGTKETVDKFPHELKLSLDEGVLNPLLAAPSVSIGNGVFSYRFGIDKADPNVTCWLLNFYGQAGFMGVTFPVSCLKGEGL